MAMFAKLSEAKSIKGQFRSRIIGDTSKSFTLELAHGNKFKLATEEGFVLSDGTTVTTYVKAANSYSQAPFSQAELQRFLSKPEVIGWEAFLQSKPGSDISGATVGDSKTVQGHDVQPVTVTLAPNGHTTTLFVDPKLGLPTGWTVNTKKGDLLVLSDSISTEPLPDAEFAFVAPTGATSGASASQTSSGATFAAVQQLMNDNCMPCHSASSRRSGVDVSSYDGILATVTPGNSSGSYLIKALKGDGLDLMPKRRAPFTDDQIATIAKWIDSGAKNE
jgi:outer membrane lipoprotein-sorting protein